MRNPRPPAFPIRLLLGLVLVLGLAAGCRRTAPGPEPIIDDIEPGPAATLEVRILANEVDDYAAVAAASDYFGQVLQDSRTRQQLEALADEGKPPPPPKPAEGKDSFPNGWTYAWVELSPMHLRTVGLDNAAEHDPRRGPFWQEVALARRKGMLYPLARCPLWSRTCRNRRLTEGERGQKAYEYFLLVRDPVCGNIAEPAAVITGQFLVGADPVRDGRGQLAVNLRFSEKGGALLNDLTSKNKPSREGIEQEWFHRYAAILLDGQVLSAPRIQEPFRAECQVTGNFGWEDIRTIVGGLRGAILARVAPETP